MSPALVIVILAAVGLIGYALYSYAQPSTSDNTVPGNTSSDNTDYSEGDQDSSSSPLGGIVSSLLSVPSGMPSAKIQQIANAIAAAEGYGPAGNIPTKANNPGDLCLGDVGYGTITSTGGEKITVFPDITTGWNKLYNQIALWISGGSQYYNTSMTWAEIGAVWAGPNTPWGQNVANALGVDVNSTLSDFLNS
jgi:hypothetical protein